MVKTMKIAGVSAAVLASVCSFAVLANPSQVRAEGGCNATPSVQDFSAYYYDESVNKAHVEYTGEMPLCDGATMTFSLNSYSDEGAEWETSGNQKFVDHATVVLTNEKTSADLEVKLPEGDDCFFQTDLYSNGKKYDGVDGPLPHYPDTEAPDDTSTRVRVAAMSAPVVTVVVSLLPLRPSRALRCFPTRVQSSVTFLVCSRLALV